MVGLVDCNSFYASVERVFDPSLRGRPVIVASNNDGACVARSQEAKDLGIKMGVPLFEIKDIIEKNNVAVFSSNYTLYGDMSARVMEIVRDIIKEQEVYSIDECFLNLDGYPIEQLEGIALNIRRTVGRWTGLPVSVGFAKTKVLAKVANKLAKKSATGVLVLHDTEDVSMALKNFPVEDLWGIGHRYADKLKRLGIDTALKFRNLPDGWLRTNMTVNGLRMAMELRGHPCFTMEYFAPDRKAIGSAKSFGTPVTTLSEMKEALSTYLSTCASKLRAQHSAASILSVFVQTNFFNKNDKQYSNSRTVSINPTSNLTPVLLKHAVHSLERIFREGYKYKRVGILLSGFAPEDMVQTDMFITMDHSKMKRAQDVIDSINKKHSRDQVRFACQGFEKRWKMKQEMLSKRFTTNIDEILTVEV